MVENCIVSRPINLAAAGLLFFGTGALAASQGEFDVTYTAEVLSEEDWLQIGPAQRQAMFVLELTTTEEGAFLGATKATCHFTREENTADGAYKNAGWCAWRDKDGDQFFEPWEGSAPSEEAILYGTGRLSGGTGKFAGISGSLSWSWGKPADISVGPGWDYGELGRQRGFYRLPSQ